MIPRTHGDDKDDADGGASETSLLVSKLQDETLMILPTLFTFDARLQLQWIIGMICKLAMLFFITNFYVMLLTWTSFLERIIMWLDHWTPVDTADAEMPNDADEQDDLRSRRSRRREEIDLWKETIGHLYWKHLEVPLNYAPRCVDFFWVVEKLKLRAWQEVLYMTTGCKQLRIRMDTFYFILRVYTHRYTSCINLFYIHSFTPPFVHLCIHTHLEFPGILGWKPETLAQLSNLRGWKHLVITEGDFLWDFATTWILPRNFAKPFTFSSIREERLVCFLVYGICQW